MTTNANSGSAPDGARNRRAGRLIERALSRSDDTVTALLERVTGEVVEADVMVQTAIVLTDRGPLDVKPGQLVVRRQAIIRGATSRRDYLYAETLLVPDRLPAGVPELLAATNAPIGRVLAARGFPMTRAMLDGPLRTPTVARLDPANCVASAIYARRCRVDSSGIAVMLIDEWFCAICPLPCSHAADGAHRRIVARGGLARHPPRRAIRRASDTAAVRRAGCPHEITFRTAPRRGQAYRISAVQLASVRGIPPSTCEVTMAVRATRGASTPGTPCASFAQADMEVAR